MEELMDQEKRNRFKLLGEFYIVVSGDCDETRGDNILHADSPDEAKKLLAEMKDGTVLVPLRTFVDAGYPVHCWDKFGYLEDISYEYWKTFKSGKTYY